MQTSKRLIKQTKRKFFLFSFIGILLVCAISFVALNFHQEIVSKQASIQDLHNRISRQFELTSKISTLSERFNDLKSIEQEEILKEEFSNLVLELNEENRSFNYWLKDNKFTTTEIEDLLEKKEVKKKMLLYLRRARMLINDKDLSLDEVKSHVKFLSQNSREGIGEVLSYINEKISLEQKVALSQLNRTGFLLVALCLLQVILVWVLVFRPLYSTILVQHEKLAAALLSAKSASRSKTDFLANISHEIRTPMTAITGYADILRRDGISKAEKDDAIKIINQNSSHLLSLIDEILDISKIEAGKFDFKKEDVHLSTLLNEVYSLINVKSEDKGIGLVFRNQGKIPRYIQADPKRLKQILFNILGNAIKFTEEGYVELVVSFNQARKKLITRIKDTGMGIPKEKRKKLFRPFEQADTSVSREYGGTGLGLVLSKGLARGMGGDINIIDTQVDVGTTFEILIDVGSVENLELVSDFSTNIIKKETETEIDDSLLSDKKILVVDDAKENARLFQMYLKEAGADVEVANDGQLAIDLATKKYFDLVLLDLQMPGKDGFQVIKELRGRAFSRPIVALTAHAMEEEKQKTMQAGFDDHITKPVTPKYLVESVAKLV